MHPRPAVQCQPLRLRPPTGADQTTRRAQGPGAVQKWRRFVWPSPFHKFIVDGSCKEGCPNAKAAARAIFQWAGEAANNIEDHKISMKIRRLRETYVAWLSKAIAGKELLRGPGLQIGRSFWQRRRGVEKLPSRASPQQTPGKD